MFNDTKSGRSIEFFIFDIFIAIQKIKNTIKAFDEAESLLHDYKSWDSVIREFEIIGEATGRLINNKLLSDEYRIIVDFRNRIVRSIY